MELTNKEHNDLWTTYNGNADQSNKKDRILHVQAHTSNDEPMVERRKMVPGKKQLYEKYNNQQWKHGLRKPK